jgi:hypothetical protein
MALFKAALAALERFGKIPHRSRSIGNTRSLRFSSKLEKPRDNGTAHDSDKSYGRPQKNKQKFL